MVRWLSSLTRGRFAQVKGATAVIGAVALLASAAVAGCADSDSGRTSLAAADAPVALGSGPADALQEQYEAVIKAYCPPWSRSARRTRPGSGVVYDDKGDIVTNAHVVGSASTVQVVTDVGGGHADREGARRLRARRPRRDQGHVRCRVSASGDVRPVRRRFRPGR